MTLDDLNHVQTSAHKAPAERPGRETAAASVPSAATSERSVLEASNGMRKRSRLAQPISDDEIAAYAAGRAFLAGEWFGATLMVASFTFLYILDFGTEATIATIYAVCAACLGVGTLAFLRARTYYERLDSNVAPRLHVIAAVVAGSAGIFWLLFALLVTLAWLGVPLQ